MYVWMSTSLDTQTVSIPLQSLRWIVLHVLSRAAPNMTFRGAKRLARTWPRSAHRWAILLDVAQGKTVRPPSTLVLVGCRCWDCHPTITNPTKLALLGGSGKVFMQIMYWANGFLIFGLLAEEDPSMWGMDHYQQSSKQIDHANSCQFTSKARHSSKWWPNKCSTVGHHSHPSAAQCSCRLLSIHCRCHGVSTAVIPPQSFPHRQPVPRNEWACRCIEQNSVRGI